LFYRKLVWRGALPAGEEDLLGRWWANPDKLLQQAAKKASNSIYKDFKG
jgi:hypothetical protein